MWTHYLNSHFYETITYQAFNNFSILHGAVSALKCSGHVTELHSSGTWNQLVKKLPSKLKTKWGLDMYDMQPKSPTSMGFEMA